MALKFTATFKIPDIQKKLKDYEKRAKQNIVNRFSQIGETFVNNARVNGEYTNQSFNLVSSIAYVVLENGKVSRSNFKEIGGGAEGVLKAKKVVEKIKSEYGKGISLIVVAGMEYAAMIESRGKDVITGSSLMAKKQLKNAFKR